LDSTEADGVDAVVGVEVVGIGGAAFGRPSGSNWREENGFVPEGGIGTGKRHQRRRNSGNKRKLGIINLLKFY
jgi:hypothetical protein